MIRVLICEDELMAQNLIRMYIEQSPDYELAGCIESAAFALSFCMMNCLFPLPFDPETEDGLEDVEPS